MCQNWRLPISVWVKHLPTHMTSIVDSRPGRNLGDSLARPLLPLVRARTMVGNRLEEVELYHPLPDL